MTINLDVRPLSELPHREGFKFRGIPKDLSKRHLNCRLKHLPGVGLFISAKGRYVYDDVSPELAGWLPHPARSLSSSDKGADRG